MDSDERLGLSIESAASTLAHSIMPCDASFGTDATGVTVGSLSEAVMGVTSGLAKIAEAITRLAEAQEAICNRQVQ